MPVVVPSPRLHAGRLALGLLVCAAGAHAQAPARTAPPDTPARAASPAQPWATDAVVRQGMGAIGQLMQAQQAAIAQDQLQAADYQRLAQAIGTHLAPLAQHRMAVPAAQKAFNQVVLADLNHGLALMRSGTTPALQRTGALGVQQALRHYANFFQHPPGP